MAYGDFKDLHRTIVADEVFCDKAFNIDENPKYGGYQPGHGSVVYKYLG